MYSIEIMYLFDKLIFSSKRLKELIVLFVFIECVNECNSIYNYVILSINKWKNNFLSIKILYNMAAYFGIKLYCLYTTHLFFREI